MEKIIKLKKIFLKEKIDGYIIPKNNEFFNEYVENNEDRLKYISKFSGSFGYALILKNKNYLFVDGRYSIQAKIESGDFFKIVTLPHQMPNTILKGIKIKIGFDPKLFTKKKIELFFKGTSCKPVAINKNLVDQVWNRNKKSKLSKFYYLPNDTVGLTLKNKLNKVVKNIKNFNADYHLISASENSAWLLNIRGKDSNYSPLPNCFILLDSKKNIFLFANLKKISSSFKRKNKFLKVIDIKKLDIILSKIKRKKFIIDQNTCSFFYEDIISKNNEISNYTDPIYALKSVKTQKEIEYIKKAHIYDGAALTKYLFWLKKNYDKKVITEISGEEKLLKFRKKNKFFKFLSFPTISGVGSNGAIIHYRANKKTNKILKKGSIYLVDSGGQYNFGTTDVTRTISLDNNERRVKNIFTRVLKGHIAVANYKLKKGTVGSQIDKTARKYLKEINLDYEHGTGHGVGFFLNVHEGPHAISKSNKVKFKKGIVISNEPGYYEKNKFGIRIENLIYTKKNKNRLIFENLTMAPIDKNLIDNSILDKDEKVWINNYHKKVNEKLKSFMNKKEAEQIKRACSAI